MIHGQEAIYEQTEANDFFRRNISQMILESTGLRKQKEGIYANIKSFYGGNVRSMQILEIGCCIGDLINKFRAEDCCQVVGIEPSSLACDYASKNFALPIINSVFNRTEYFGFKDSHYQSFDIIIADDVLSWMSRELILPVNASIDWLIKPGGGFYLRDFCPPVDFAYPNHHQEGNDVFNYKVSGGHKKFFLDSGKYYLAQDYVRTDSRYQKTRTSRVDSMIWSDALLIKNEQPLYPRLEM